MGDAAENAASRLWRDRAHVRERECNEAQARARAGEDKLAALTAENDRLASRNTHLGDQNNRLAVEIARLGAQNDRLAVEIARLGAQNDRLAVEIVRLRTLMPDTARTHAETEQQMEALRTELVSLLD
jgi:chromosome segregation ATPase